MEDKTSHEVHCTHSKTNFKSTSAKGREREREREREEKLKKTRTRRPEREKKKTGTEIREKKKLQRINITSKENIGLELNFQLKY